MNWAFEWWAWAIFALALVILEILAPAFVLLGFGIGAGVISVVLLIGGPGLFGGSLPWILTVFAALSLAAWIGLRQIFKLPKGQVKTFDHDIND
ncbi:MAG: hypothetical protein AAF701_05805 [Pseudomonadota bacterium]